VIEQNDIEPVKRQPFERRGAVMGGADKAAERCQFIAGIWNR
jgi:hypothetical protein